MNASTDTFARAQGARDGQAVAQAVEARVAAMSMQQLTDRVAELAVRWSVDRELSPAKKSEIAMLNFGLPTDTRILDNFDVMALAKTMKEQTVEADAIHRRLWSLGAFGSGGSEDATGAASGVAAAALERRSAAVCTKVANAVQIFRNILEARTDAFTDSS